MILCSHYTGVLCYTSIFPRKKCGEVGMLKLRMMESEGVWGLISFPKIKTFQISRNKNKKQLYYCNLKVQ